MVFAAFLAEIQALGPGVCDALFYASSAGGLYAGATEPPFTEEHPVIPISPYGHAKQAAELAVRQFADSTGTPSLIGRIANLYGAGQNLSKQQGLISHLCRAQIAAQPASIFVSLDTLRDYLFVDDCAEMVADALDDVSWVVSEGGGMGHSVVKIFASQQATTVGALIGECRRVLKRPLRVVRGSSPVAGYQTRDLRLRSTVWSSLDRRALTPLPVGIHATYDGLLRLRQAPPLPVSLASRRYPQGGVSAP
jgi:UDP-glucose 4-epimerase